MKDFTIELTIHEKIKEISNCMCHNFYYVQRGRIYNADHTEFKRFRFVLWFDIYDVCEYFDKEDVTIQEITQYAKETGWNYCESNTNLIKSFNDCNEFYAWCNETINYYNGN